VCYHYGLSPKEVWKLKFKDVLQMSQIVDKIKAEEALLSLNISDYPNMKNEDRKKLFNSLKNKAYPDKTKDIIKGSEMARKLAEWQKK